MKKFLMLSGFGIGMLAFLISRRAGRDFLATPDGWTSVDAIKLFIPGVYNVSHKDKTYMVESCDVVVLDGVNWYYDPECADIGRSWEWGAINNCVSGNGVRIFVRSAALFGSRTK